MIERHGEYAFDVSCDECPEVEEFEMDDWSPLLEAIREAGWSYRKVYGDWMHYCPDCTRGREAVTT